MFEYLKANFLIAYFLQTTGTYLILHQLMKYLHFRSHSYFRMNPFHIRLACDLIRLV